MMRQTLWFCLMGVVMLVGAVSAEEPATLPPARAVPVKNILLIGTPPDHPHGSHMYMHECRLLAKCLEQSHGIVTRISQGWPQDPDMLKDLSAIVFYSNPAGDVVLNESNRQQFMQLMKQGVGFAAIHWATATNDPKLSDPYIDILGACFNFGFAKPPLATSRERLIQADPSHSINRGWAEYDLTDEWYLSMKYHPDAKPLLRVLVPADEKQGRSQPTDLIVGWTYSRPDSNGGRSFGTTLGHFHANFAIEAFRRMLVNGILWTAHVEIPQGGASVRVTDVDLILPPALP